MSNENPDVYISNLPELAYWDKKAAWAFLMRQNNLSLENCIPATVETYDRETNLASVWPSVLMTLAQTDENGENVTVPFAPMTLPVLTLGGGGIVFNVPLNLGDTGWIIGADVDTSEFKNTRKISNQQTLAIHKYQFGFFIPDQIKGFSVAPSDDGAAVWQTLDGTTKISLKDGKISLYTTAEVDIQAPLVTILGNVEVNGNITATGTITGSTDVVAAGISGKGHTHGGIQRGSSNTDSPS